MIIYILGCVVAWVMGIIALAVGKGKDCTKDEDIMGCTIVMFLLGFLSWFIVALYVMLILVENLRKLYKK